MRYDRQGRELPDPTPLEIPAGFARPPTLAEQIERCFRQVVSRNAAARGHETFEEANDFEVDDDDPSVANTPYTDMGHDAVGGAQPDATVPGVPGTPPGRGTPGGQPGAAAGGVAQGGNPNVKPGPGGVPGNVGGQPGQPPVGNSPPAG